MNNSISTNTTTPKFIARPGYGLLCIILGTTLFAMKSIFIKLAYGYGVTAEILMTLRTIFSLPFYLGALLFVPKVDKASLTPKLIMGIAGLGFIGYYLSSLIDLTGLQYISASFERLILYVYPTFVVVFSALIFKTKMRFELLGCIAIIYAGLFLVLIQNINSLPVISPDISTIFGQVSSTGYGAALVFFSAMLFALYLIGAGVVLRTLNSHLFTAIAMIAACISMIVHFGFSSSFDVLLQQNSAVYILAFILAFACTVIPSFIVSMGIRHMGTQKASIAGSLGPIGTLILAAVILGETVTFIQILGFSIVIGGVALLGRLED